MRMTPDEVLAITGASADKIIERCSEGYAGVIM